MKAEQTAARLSAIFLLVFLFTGTKSFSQSLRDQEQTIRESRVKDSIAFNNYFDRRATIAAIKDSVQAENDAFGNGAPRSASASSVKSVGKTNTSELNLIQTSNTGKSLSSSAFFYNSADIDRRRVPNQR